MPPTRRTDTNRALMVRVRSLGTSIELVERVMSGPFYKETGLSER